MKNNRIKFNNSTQEEKHCPVCGAHFTPTNILTFTDYVLIVCSHCQVRFCQPFIDNRLIYTAQQITQKNEYLETSGIDIHPKLLPYVHVKNKRILDIGCGTGSFLSTLKENNEILGLEVSEAYGPVLAKKGIPHKIGDLENQLSSLPDSYYDLVTFWDVFEHLQDPVMILHLVKDKLIDGGIVINWTNNYDDFISRSAEIIYRTSGGRIYSLMEQSFNRIGGHNYNFVAKSLEQVYHKTGFEIVETIVTDTPSYRISNNLVFRFVLEVFYLVNKAFGKGKIICHVLKKNT